MEKDANLTNKATEIVKVSDHKRYGQFFWRSWAIQDSWNYERQMNMGFLYGIAPTIDRLYPNVNDQKQVEKRKEAYKRHMAFYNCTPQLSAFVLGLSSSMEEEYAANPDTFDPESINAVKTSLMGPLSGIGDSFFQGTIRVVAFGLGASLAAQGSMLGPVLAMIISAAFSIPITWYAGKYGYKMGRNYLEKLQSGTMDKIMYACGIVGLMAIGGMVATMVDITTPLGFADQSFELQTVLDGVIPQILSLAAVMAMYGLIKKNVKTGWLLVICILGGILLSAVGIFA
jgi:PTS system mannose-specific IID component/fructoselysine and glucoselysine-specific PTS system IID component